MSNCVSCGKRLKKDERFCPHCGADQHPVPKTEKPAPEEQGYPQQGPYGMAPYGYPQQGAYGMAPYGYPQMLYGNGMAVVAPYGQYPQTPAYGWGPQYPYGQPYGQPPYGQQAGGPPNPPAYVREEEAKKQEEAKEQAFLAAESYFTGGAVMRFFVNFFVWFTSLITLFFAYPAMTCWRESWTCRHTFINGKRLRFDGFGANLFGKYILWGFLSLITIGIYGILCMPLNMERWMTKNTHFIDSGETAVSRFDGRIWGMFGVRIASFLVTVLTLTFGHYWAMCYRNRWYARHTVIDGYRLKFTGKGTQLFGKIVLWTLLTVITLGIYGFWLVNSTIKWRVKHTRVAVREVPAVESAR